MEFSVSLELDSAHSAQIAIHADTLKKKKI